jgi:hypothetical protein
MAPVAVHLMPPRTGKLALVDQTIAVSVDLIEGGGGLGIDPSSSLVALAAQFQEQTLPLETV